MKSCLEKNRNSRAHDGQNTHSWCTTCSKRAAHLARTPLGSTTVHQGGEGEKKGSEMTLQLPFLSSLGAVHPEAFQHQGTEAGVPMPACPRSFKSLNPASVPQNQIKSWRQVLGKVEKNSFTALVGRGDHSGLMPTKLHVPRPPSQMVVRSFIVIIQRGCD